MLAFFSDKGITVLSALSGGAFLVGLCLGALRVKPLVRAALFVLGPAAAIVAYRVINPDPGCDYDCPGKAAWAVILAAGTVAWWAGLGITTSYRLLAERRKPTQTDP